MLSSYANLQTAPDICMVVSAGSRVITVRSRARAWKGLGVGCSLGAHRDKYWNIDGGSLSGIHTTELTPIS